ncbi:MAG: sulfotransferase [Egibacteraceae bacterium]
MNAGVVFIGGAAHSGSTLLGVMLGAHPSVLYAGEVRKSLLLGDPTWPLKMRVCRLCGPDCVVWGDLRPASGEEDLYETLSRRTSRPIVVDSSSSVDWIAQQAAVLRDVVPLHLVVLVRDGRAVVNSRLRKYPETSAAGQAAAWSAHMRATEALASRWPGSVCRVRYEELATWPEPTLRSLAGFLGVVFDPGMLDPWDSEPHPLGSNDGPLLLLLRERAKRVSGHGAGVVEPDDKTRDWYAAHPRGIVLDLRWKHEMGADALAAFEAVAGETNRAYAWEETVR